MRYPTLKKDILKLLKISIFIILIIDIFILDKLYLLPLHTSLNTIPNNKRSATYLAKAIAKKARCMHLYLEDVSDSKILFKFDCNFGFFGKNTYAPFFIYIFSDTNVKDTWINKEVKNTSSTNYKRCLKQGDAYVICDMLWSPTSTLEKTEKKTSSVRKEYYQQFPGEDLIYTNNKITKTITKKDSHHVHTK